MHSEFSEETQHRITGLCSKISVANHLNDEIREELHGHIADKMEAYLDGSEVITEDDAFVLVREHFGNPEVIRSMYEVAEPVAAYGGFLRRLGAILVATSLCFWFTSYVLEVIFTLFVKMTPVSVNPDPLIFGIPQSFSVIIGVLLYIVALTHWKKKMRLGQQPWFMKIKPYWFIGIIVLSEIALYMVIPFTHQITAPHNDIFDYTLVGGLLVHCMFWVWWLDNNAKRLLYVFTGFFAWFAAFFFKFYWIYFWSIIRNMISRAPLENMSFPMRELARGLENHVLVVGPIGAFAVLIYLLLIGVQAARRKMAYSFTQ